MLQTQQSRFQAFLLGQINAKDIAHEIEEGRLTTKAELLDVYFQAYRLRLIEALETEFPTLARTMDETDFREMAIGYIQAHPSRHPSVRWYGQYLANFLRQTPPFSATPHLADIAEFEWALSLAFDAQDCPAANEADAAVIPADAWPVLQLRFLPSVHRVSLQSNATQLRQATDQEAEALPDIVTLDTPVEWVVWRPELITEFRSMENDEAKAFDCAAGGGTFSDICTTLLRWSDEASVAARAAGLLRVWLQQGLVAELITDPNAS